MAHDHWQACACTCRDQIIGIFLAKELMLMDKQQEMAVTALKLRSAPYLRADIALYDMLRLFETGRCHMAVLTQPLRKEGIHPAEVGRFGRLTRHRNLRKPLLLWLCPLQQPVRKWQGHTAEVLMSAVG